MNQKQEAHKMCRPYWMDWATKHFSLSQSCFCSLNEMHHHEKCCLHKCHLPCPYPVNELEFHRRHSDDCSTAAPSIDWHFRISSPHPRPICELFGNFRLRLLERERKTKNKQTNKHIVKNAVKWNENGFLLITHRYNFVYEINGLDILTSYFDGLAVMY